jgi:hypothetical protein
MNQSLDKVVDRVADDLMQQGAQAVVLIGSRVRGDAHAESDVDIVVIGEGPDYHLERMDGYLVSISRYSEDRWRAAFDTPNEAGGAIPGWRGARILRDPDGIAAALQTEAHAWTWDRIGGACDVWVAEQITGWAEEVHKLIAALELGRTSAAAVQRNLLATHLAPMLAVHFRMMYDTENVLWDLVAARTDSAARIGEGWSRAQAAAFSVDGEGFEGSCRAALRLYLLAAREVHRLLDARQREVVDYACGLAEYGDKR